MLQRLGQPCVNPGNQIEQVATFSHPYVMPYENDLPIFLCRQPKFSSLKELWPQVKCYSC